MRETGEYERKSPSEILLNVRDASRASSSSSNQSSSPNSHPVLTQETYSSSCLSSRNGSTAMSRCAAVYRRCICGKQLASFAPLEKHRFVRIHPKWIQLSRRSYSQLRTEVDLRRSIFVTILSGNFLPETEVKDMFSRLGNVITVRWCQLGLSNGYVVAFGSREQMLNALKVTGDRMDTNGRVLTIEWANPMRIKWRLCMSLAMRIVKSRAKRSAIRSSSTLTEEAWPVAISVDKLNDIYVNHLQTYCVKAQSESANDSQCFMKTGPLTLPAPYHLLPDTPYFRKALIVPPPVRGPTVIKRPPLLSRIISRYLASMTADDERCFERIAQLEQNLPAEQKTREEQATMEVTAARCFLADASSGWLHELESTCPSQMPYVKSCSQPRSIHVNQKTEGSSMMLSGIPGERGRADLEPQHIDADWKADKFRNTPFEVSYGFGKVTPNPLRPDTSSHMPPQSENSVSESPNECNSWKVLKTTKILPEMPNQNGNAGTNGLSLRFTHIFWN
ncbi:hypothetical protein Tcan_03665 [Toxocara canis]|uniref:RRM domain-containing protein n=2 Tax=Toxocara canis TaxID=6265 RepID=A0A0B2VAI8_TOXCA|nr:hypothetical protein Tcan_03665 [Toxocara canis]VDM24832.1 unnamed protein product [Toxocara canis]